MCIRDSTKTKRNQRQTVSIAVNDLGVETNINKLNATLLHKGKEDANLRSASSLPLCSNELARIPFPTLYLLNDIVYDKIIYFVHYMRRR